MQKAFSKLEIKSADEETGIIIGLASTPKTDRVGDVVEPFGASYSLPIPLLFSHDHNQPIGAVTEVKIVPDGIRVVAKLAIDASERIREVWSLIKAGALRGLSVGFMPLERNPLPDGGYRFTRWDWHELSVCAVPANAGATISNIKHYSAQPVSAVRIHPLKETRKEKSVSLHQKPASTDIIGKGATLQWLARAKAYRQIMEGSYDELAAKLGAPDEIVRRLKAVAEGNAS